MKESPSVLRSYLHSILTTAPVDFSIETNAKIGKILEYKYYLLFIYLFNPFFYFIFKN